MDRQGQRRNQRPMYEAEIALLSGNVENRFGPGFVEDVAKLRAFFGEELGHPGRQRPRLRAGHVGAAAGQKARGPRTSGSPWSGCTTSSSSTACFPDYNEEQINMRLVGYFAGV